MGMPNKSIIAIDADHMEMTKFVSSMDQGYRQIIQHIMRDPLTEADRLGQLSKLIQYSTRRLPAHIL